MASSEEARHAVYAAVVEVCEEAKEYTGSAKSGMVRDAAVAYRAAQGGAQPGGSVPA